MVPVIRIELEGWKESLQVAIHNHMVSMDADIQRIIQSKVTIEKIEEQLRKHVNDAFQRMLQQEISNLFGYGSPARATVREELHKLVDSNFKD